MTIMGSNRTFAALQRLFQRHKHERPLTTSARQLLGFLPILVIAILLAGFTEVLLPHGFVEKWLSDTSGWHGIASPGGLGS